MSCPSMVVVYCGIWLSRASCARQSYLVVVQKPKRVWMTDPSEPRSQITPDLPALSTASCAYAPSAVNLSRLPKVPLVAVTCRP